jgi:hypothetical protein
VCDVPTFDGWTRDGNQMTNRHNVTESALRMESDEPLSEQSITTPTNRVARAGNSGPKSWAVGVLALLGVALIVMPLTFNMFNRAPKGATMLKQFKPFMTTTRLNGFQTDIRQIDAGVKDAEREVAQFLTGSSDPAEARSQFDTAYPTFAGFSAQWGAIDAHMSDLLDRVQGNLPNYQAVAALPSFTLFPLFFVIPGALVLLLLGAYLIRARWWGTIRWVLVALGVGLILAPVAFQMFQRAPRGGRMMSAFRTIETTSNVQRIQGYFGTMAVGQGAIRLELVPALEKAGLTTGQIQVQFPAVATLDERWVHILNDMTPMIGAMSDNVTNYQAIAALPPFPLFPYFFVLPGIFIGGAAIIAGPERRRHPLRDAFQTTTVSSHDVSNYNKKRNPT